MNKFISGLQLSELFYKEVVKNILETEFPKLKYSAGLIGSGSEVFGFDTLRSIDHHWGPRVLIFLGEADFKNKQKISNIFSKQLPVTFHGYSTHFGDPDDMGVRLLEKAKKGQLLNHRVEIFTIKSFFNDYLNINPYGEITELEWLTMSAQKLRSIKSGKIFYDQLGLKEMQKNLNYYPKDVWFYLLASEWQKISQEEPFVGRSGEVNDELGSKIIAVRLVHSIMTLCFMMEKEYAPYSKWFGTAFSNLKCAKKIIPILHKVMSSKNWEKREKYLSQAYEEIAKIHNRLKITKPLPIKVSNFHDRPYLVIHGDVFATEVKKKITSKVIRKIKNNIGSVNQITNSVDLLENNNLLKKMEVLYK